MAAAPADLVGLPGRGRIEVGASADFCVLAPEEPFVVEAAALHHRNPVTAYAGRTLRGVVRSTWLRGRLAAEHGTTTRPLGRLLERDGA